MQVVEHAVKTRFAQWRRTCNPIKERDIMDEWNFPKPVSQSVSVFFILDHY